MKIHQKYILRCIQLGEKGLGTTAPNPMVGCVVVHDGEIIGEGYTSPYGGSHAEVNAINSVKNKKLLSSSTLYVTLEPCSHHGKTPPCADLIAAHKIPHVVIGLKDPHSKVAGKGIEKLKQSGCEVTVGVLEKDCRWHHKRFLSFHEKNRPFVILKWAETEDGFIAPESNKRNSEPEPFWITNTYSRQLVHKWRSEEQAILVGTNTVLEDNPKLTSRNWNGKNPIRVVLDRALRLDIDHHVFDKTVKTIVITEVKESRKYIEGVDYEVIDFSESIAKQVCEVLYWHSITSVLIEGGRMTLQAFIHENLWDEARIFKGSSQFGNGVTAPKVSGSVWSIQQILSDQLTIMTND
ncbi:bifunctional diaminohydroxyphosphoribosylaminopyrimidine deaminase/5-amino-6-(5-phosphoribosylamino)uracil reductase RibD [Flagellimonas nanhaiensis]|uniref:Riboflavin biosynthesis protein RibD n=1 Tax=Flagellimonas nanhaiensis TaxID=2292706 RepID=A0A371JU20_9FLAO|nr:bifunctional diaminohydroxyphosphoribosylaminopyrimidine deaminase/5-amino-6-(5-phosphoribosylamino)uracil reductase RibD [Allomuricauda nanhaiensis]RDY61311.1 bifunctional diaminohydroxyphosphoribosylaminopyrimidine deaminase/5-amino-6-(5-phosphoribosylamino)uracil reductase RibD [Allomuricauda nanhaiensis]